MLLLIYIASVCYYWLCTLIVVLTLYQRIKINGITNYKMQSTDAKGMMKIITISLIPFLNVGVGIYYIMSKTVNDIIDEEIKRAKQIMNGKE